MTIKTAQPNSDPAEIHKFSQLAHRWWDTGSEFRPLHEINPLRLEWMQRFVAFSNRQVLDVGCGGGILSEGMARLGARVTGIDLAKKSLQVAELHSLESGLSIDYRCIAAEEIAAEHPARFDIVSCMEMLEHVPDPSAIVAACATACKPGGWVFFSTIHRNLKSFLAAIVGAEYLLGLLPKGTHHYDKFIRPAELAAYCRTAGLQVDTMTGLSYNPLTRMYRLTPDTSVNYMLACHKPRGAQ
jgi:2-polyprenyl-6-hydroxyphenyl methylase/3-demethylubiquinone-9 3-methyltransferase